MAFVLLKYGDESFQEAYGGDLFTMLHPPPLPLAISAVWFPGGQFVPTNVGQ